MTDLMFPEPAPLTPTERRAVEEAAELMAAWRQGKLADKEDDEEMDEAARFEAPKNPPHAPIVRLRERGTIDEIREAHLTAEAYALSVELDPDSVGLSVRERVAERGSGA